MAVSRRGIEEVAVDPVPFGRYVLLDRIAEGRLGAVHRACLSDDPRPDRLLAIKLVSPQLSRDPAFAEQFQRLMSRAAELDHAAHCAIQDFGCARDGSLYAAMNLVPGKDLGRIADVLHERGAVMPAPLLAYVGSRIAEALAEAHAMRHAGKPAPLYHGELAPSDILIGYDGSVCLTGLGSAALQAASPDPTPRYGYRAPELDGGICTAQSDVFSLGACLSELLTGRPALRTDTQGSFSVENRRRESHITRVVPRELEQIVRRALQGDPAARWQGTAELADALQRWCSTQTSRGDAAALATFMHEMFDEAQEAEAERLQICLARLVAMHSPTSQRAPEARSSYPQLVRARQNARASASVRPGAAQPNQSQPAASAAPQRDPKPESWTDESEQTPARGVLMKELAAEMTGTERSKPQPPEPVLDNPWDDDSPAERWISEGEEREAVEWLMQPRKPVPAIVAAPLIAPVRVASVQPQAQPQAQAQPLPSALPMSPDPMWPARGTPLRLPALAGAALLAVIAAVALLRNGANHPQPTLPVQTSVKSSPEPVAASAAAAIPDLQQQIAPTQVAEKAEPQAARTPDRDESDRGRSRRRRAALEPTAPDSERAASAATTDANDHDAFPTPAAVDPAPRREPASTATEPSPVPVATPPATAPAAKAIEPARSAALAPAPRAPAATVSSGPSHAAVLIERTTPRLSARARRIGITEGVALIEITIDRNGAVTNASVVKAEPQDIFEGAALKELREWRYQPALANGTPIESKQRVTIRFTE